MGIGTNWDSDDFERGHAEAGRLRMEKKNADLRAEIDRQEIVMQAKTEEIDAMEVEIKGLREALVFVAASSTHAAAALPTAPAETTPDPEAGEG